ncbi:MAG TPA: FaeA/PapI family transcriptional regulator [Solirubrobacterales bacterium]
MTEGSVAAVRKVIREQQKQLQQRYSSELRQLKERRDSELARLEQALAGLEEGGRPQREPKRKRARRRARAAGTPAAIRERCEAVHRFLVERKEPVSVNAMAAALGVSSHAVRTALRLLSEEGKVRRIGTGAETRYEAIGSKGTLPGRIVAFVEERGWASLEELVQATGVTHPEVRQACEALVREGEIRTMQRGGVTVFVLAA